MSTPTVEGTYTSTDKKTTTSTITSVVVPGTGGNRAIYVFLSGSQKSDFGARFASAVSWSEGGGEAFSKVGTGEGENGVSTVMIWKLIDPTTGTGTVTITWDNNNSNWDGSVHAAVVLSNMDQSTPDDGWEFASSFGTSLDLAVATATDDLVYGVTTAGDDSGNTLSEDGDGTEQWNDINATCRAAGVSHTATDASSALAFTCNNASEWVFAGCSLNYDLFVGAAEEVILID